MADRDLSVDLARVLCLLAVVGIHTAMVGIGGDAQAGELQLANPLTDLWFFAVGTWVGQGMPLFFLLGGFGAHLAMSRTPRADAVDFPAHLRRRTLRLGLPAAVFYLVITGLTVAAGLAGVPEELLAPALEGIGDPLWFLAAFLICQGFVRAQHRLVSAESPGRLWAVIAATVVGIVVVDVLRLVLASGEGLDGPAGMIGAAGTPSDALGLVNMWLVWPLMQLLGMVLADGGFARVGPLGWMAVAVSGFGVTAALATWTWYPPDMLMNLNPPTLPLISIGVTHLALFQLLRPALRAAARTTAVKGLLLLIAPRAMTLYLWHMVAVILLSGLGWLIGWAPEPGGPMWWWSRLPVFVLVLVATLTLGWPWGVLERVRRVGPAGRWSVPLAWAALYLAAAPNLVVIQRGLTSDTVVLGAVLMTAAVILAAVPFRSETPAPSPSSSPPPAPSPSSSPARAQEGSRL